jgi:glycosyltransferase involved in cell wall biosynthesis
LGDANSVHVQRWAREMLHRGWRVSVVTARPATIDGVVEQIVLPSVSRSRDWLFRCGAARRAVEGLAPDIVHAHYVTSYGYLAARAGRRPLVMTAWGSDLLLTPKQSVLVRWLTGWTLRRADLVTGDSIDLVDEAAAYGLRQPPLRVHWGVDLARFAPVPWGSKPRFEIVSLRNWEPNYRIGAIVQALALFRQREPDAEVHLHLLGGGSLQPELTSQVHALGLQEVVTLHGRLDDAGMAAVLARCKVSVSVPVSDATSVSVLESMACGLAVVASDLPANRQWLSARPDLLLADASAPAPAPALAEALAHALHALWRDDAAAHQLGAAHHARMAAEGSRAVQMDRMAAAYQTLLAAPR